MLDAMRLSKYQTAFSEFAVDGDVIVQLDDNTLDTELGVTSRIHRIRLMRIIDGRKSAKEFIDGSK